MRSALLAAYLATAVCLSLAEPSKHNVTLSDLQGLRYVAGLAISPDGKQIVYSTGGELYLASAESPNSPVQLAAGVAPSWSPDSRRLAYYAEQEGLLRLWFINVAQRTAIIASKVAPELDPSTAPAWSPDGTRLLVTLGTQPEKVPIARVPDSVPLVSVPESPPWLASSGLLRGSELIRERPSPLRRKVVIISSTGETISTVSRDEEDAAEPVWSPDGSAAAFLTFDANRSVAKLVQVSLATGARSVLAKGSSNMSSVRRSPDGHYIAFLDSAERFGLLTTAFIVTTSAAANPPRNVSRQLDREVSELAWSRDGRLMVIIRDGVNQPLGTLSLQGRFEPMTRTDAGRHMLSVATNGALAWVESDAEHLDRIWIRNADATEAKPLADPNAQIATWKLGQQRVVRWRNSRGEALEGVLVLPPDHSPGKRIPLIVDPYSHRLNAFMGIPMLANRYLAAQGYALFFPNHRGFFTFPKSLKGDAYARSAQRPEGGEIMADDILSGVDELVRTRIADPDRLGLYGFSTGASAIDLLLTKTTRFKAAVSSGGVADWIYYFLLRPTDDETIPSMLEGRTPWDAPDLYRRLSAVYQADRIRTPLLLVIGDKDSRLLDTVMFYDALRRLKHPVMLVRYPDQSHGLGGDVLQDYWSRCLSFFKEHGM